MPYKAIGDLPDSVRDHVPKHAQEIYKEAFNSAWEGYADKDERRGEESREEAAHKVAWAAVKKKYRKDDDGDWHANSPGIVRTRHEAGRAPVEIRARRRRPARTRHESSRAGMNSPTHPCRPSADRAPRRATDRPARSAGSR